MRYALIGCGRIARKHLLSAWKNGLDIVAFCDLQPAKIDELLDSAPYGELYRAAGRYTDYGTMLREARPELVAIATESGSHAHIALDCIRCGVHVMIEKPLALSMTDANAVARLAAQMNVKVCVCHQNRFNTAVKRLRDARLDDRFGKISHGSVHVRWSRGAAYYQQAAWRGTWAQDGGALMNQCIHGVDLLIWLMDSPVVTVYGATRRRLHPYLECEDVGMAVLTFANGAIATVEGTVNVYPENLEETLCLFGDCGTAKLGGMATNQIDLWRFADAGPVSDADNTQIADVYGNGHILLYRDMIDAITENRAPCCDARGGMRALEVILAIYQSQKSGMPVKLPMSAFGTMDMKGTFA